MLMDHPDAGGDRVGGSTSNAARARCAVPRSRDSIPYAILMSIVFPAPFYRAARAPCRGAQVNVARRNASSGPKCLLMCSSASAGAASLTIPWRGDERRGNAERCRRGGRRVPERRASCLDSGLVRVHDDTTPIVPRRRMVRPFADDEQLDPDVSASSNVSDDAPAPVQIAHRACAMALAG